MKNLLSFLTLLFFLHVSSQKLYTDPITTLALNGYGNELENGQNETNTQLTKLQQAQAWVSTQMVYANSIQDKIYKGLKEVSGTLSNGLQIKEIYSDLERCYTYSNQIKNLVAVHPQYSIFGVKATQKSYEQILKIYDDAQDIMTESDTNLATAGDRKILLFNISQNVKHLKIWLLQIRLNIERAERMGFWKAINPFQSYVNTDKSIVENIMRKYKNRF